MANTMDIVLGAVDRKASDIILSSGRPPHLRVDGRIEALGKEVLDEKEVRNIIQEIRPESTEVKPGADFVRDIASLPVRLRVHVSTERQGLMANIRLVARDIRLPNTLGLSERLVNAITGGVGLVVIAGPTDAGKSTTVASLVQSVNTRAEKHIITLEDPVEYVFQPGKSLIHQREVPREEFPAAVEEAMRQVPDIIVIGELRDLPTISAALGAAESGHLVIATLHARSAPEAVTRLVSVFPGAQQQMVRYQLASSLLAVSYQRLLPRIGGGRVLASELMFGTTSVANLIREDKIAGLNAALQAGSADGMQTLQQAAQALRTQIAPETLARVIESRR